MFKRIMIVSVLIYLFISGMNLNQLSNAQEQASVTKNILSTGKKLVIDEETFDIKLKHNKLLVDVQIDNPQNLLFNGSLYITVMSKDGKQVLQTIWNAYPLNHNKINVSNIIVGTELNKEDLKDCTLKYDFIYNYLPPKPECLIPGRCNGIDEEIKGTKQLSEYLN